MRDILKLSQIVPNLEFNTGGAIIYATNKPNEELEGHVEVNADWYSEELRLNGSAFDGEVDLVVGLFASREKTDAGITVGGLSESLDFVTGVTALPLVGATQSTGITWSDPRTYGVELAYT